MMAAWRFPAYSVPFILLLVPEDFLSYSPTGGVVISTVNSQLLAAGPATSTWDCWDVPSAGSDQCRISSLLI